MKTIKKLTMKKLLTITLILFSFSAIAQKSDTLIIPVGEYKFIKVGDKVYKIVRSLEEVTSNGYNFIQTPFCDTAFIHNIHVWDTKTFAN